MDTASIAAGPGRPREVEYGNTSSIFLKKTKVFACLTKVMVLNVASDLNMTITNTITKLNFTLIL